MATIHKIETTEHILKAHFFQIYNSDKYELLSSDNVLNVDKIKEKYPNFINTIDFSCIDVYDLFKFLKIERRYHFDDWEMPKYLYYFGNQNSKDLIDIKDFENFSLLLTEIEASPFNDLVGVYYYDSIFIYNQKGEFLNISANANLYDDGYCNLSFIDKEYFVFSYYDDNNGEDMSLYKYLNEQIVSYAEINSLELIGLI